MNKIFTRKNIFSAGVLISVVFVVTNMSSFIGFVLGVSKGSTYPPFNMFGQMVGFADLMAVLMVLFYILFQIYIIFWKKFNDDSLINEPKFLEFWKGLGYGFLIYFFVFFIYLFIYFYKH